MKPQSPESAAQRVATAAQHYRSLINGEARFAVLRGARSVEEAERYLPGNYALMESFEVTGQTATGKPELWIVIGGIDEAGWTLDGYVTPRLQSGLIFAEEIS